MTDWTKPAGTMIRPRNFWIVFVAAFAYSFTLFGVLNIWPLLGEMAGTTLPEAGPNGSERLAQVLTAFGPSGRELYLTFQALDVPFFTLTTVMLMLLYAVVLKRFGLLTGVFKLLPLLPLAIFFSEAVEDSILVLNTLTYPEPAQWSLPILDAATQIKMIAFQVCFLGGLVAFLAWAVAFAVRLVRSA